MPTKIIEEIDIAKKITDRGGNGFLIDLSLPPLIDVHDALLLKNGIVIILCKSENSSIIVDDKEYRLSPNSVIVLPENHVIGINSKISEQNSIIAVTIDYILNLPSPIDTNIFGYSRYMSVIKVTDDKFNDLTSYYNFLYKESLEDGKYKEQIINSIFYAFILEVVAEYEKIFNIEINDINDIKSIDLSDRFFRLLATHYKKYRSVQFYADKLSLTPKYLSTTIKRATGRPILDWIHDAILIDAKMLLRTSDLTVQQIAEQLNFSSPSAFVQFIKKHTGTTPRKLK